MIYVGIDDTDILGSPGTNQLARAIVTRLGPLANEAMICRHQLFFDPRVPYTSKNGSASIALPAATVANWAGLIDNVRDVMRRGFIKGSDPGLCIVSDVPDAMRAFGRRSQREVVRQDEARSLAAALGAHLEGLGGTEQGVIGALAAVGLAATGEDGRVVQLSRWPYPDDAFSGPQEAENILARGVDEIREVQSGARVERGVVDVGRHLRPNIRASGIVLFVARAADGGTATWLAAKLP